MNIIHKIPRLLVPVMDNKDEILRGNIITRGFVTCEHYRKGELIHTQSGHNTFTTEGMANLLNLRFGVLGKAASATVYCGLFKGNVTPAVGDTAATKLGAAGTYTECQDADYTPATNRPVYTIAATTTAVCTNAASKAEFTMLAAITAYGAFLALGQPKTDTTGALMCAKRFTTPRTTEIADMLAISYVITCSTS